MGEMADYYTDYFELEAFHEHEYQFKDLPTRSRKMTKKINRKKPTLIQVGKHFINPCDVRSISRVRKDLYIVKFISEPNPDYPCWVGKDQIGNLLSQFNIIESEEQE